MITQYLVQLLGPGARLFAAGCPSYSFLGFPPWYHYLNNAGYFTNNAGSCDPTAKLTFINGHGNLDLTVVTLAALGILDILLRLAGLVAAVYIMYAGFKYITAQGEPDKTKQALDTIINASVGLAITVVAAAAVAFLGNRVVG